MSDILIADIGSTHMGSFAQAEYACRWLLDHGIRPKLQFCPATNGNIPAPMEWLSDLAKYHCSASVWDDCGYRTVKASSRWIKFAYSQRNSPLIARALASDQIDEVFITRNIMEQKIWAYPKIKWLYTYEVNGTPVYPVTSAIDHHGLYPDKCDGFSSHCIDILQMVHAHMCHATVLEFHVCFNKTATCPDAQFGLSEAQVEALLTYVR
jgi:hypothetical protein